jgi:hypothetical protein
VKGCLNFLKLIIDKLIKLTALQQKEVPAYPRGSKAVLFYLASFLLEAQYVRVLTYKSE